MVNCSQTSTNECTQILHQLQIVQVGCATASSTKLADDESNVCPLVGRRSKDCYIFIYIYLFGCMFGSGFSNVWNVAAGRWRIVGWLFRAGWWVFFLSVSIVWVWCFGKYFRFVLKYFQFVYLLQSSDEKNDGSTWYGFLDRIGAVIDYVRKLCAYCIISIELIKDFSYFYSWIFIVQIYLCTKMIMFDWKYIQILTI